MRHNQNNENDRLSVIQGGADENENNEITDIREILTDSELVFTEQFHVLFDIIDFNQIITDYNKNKRAKLLTNRSGTITKDEHRDIVIESTKHKIMNDLTILNERFYYKGVDRHWYELENVNSQSFKTFLTIILSAINESPTISKLSSNDLTDLITRTNNTNNIVQFNDCYFEGSKLYEGVYGIRIPRFRVRKSVWSAIKDGEPKASSDEVDELLNHITNNDTTARKRLIETLSLSLICDPNKQSVLGKMVRIFGPTGSNGKSTLMKLFSYTLGFENVGSFSSQRFTNYELADVMQRMLAYDDDEQGNRIPEEASSNLKSAITGDSLMVRQIRGKPESIRSSVQLVSLSNALPKSEDKTEGFARRLDWYEVDNKLIKSDEWFERLFSEESTQYLIELLVTSLIDLLNRRPMKLTEKSKRMLMTEKKFNHNNNSILGFIEEQGKDWFVNRTVKSVSVAYEDYCYENDLNKLGRSKFNSTIESQLNLKRENMLFGHTANYDESKADDIDLNEQVVINMDQDGSFDEYAKLKRIRAWMKK